MKSLKTLIYLFLIIGLISCNPDEVEPEEPVELITTLEYSLQPNGGGDPIVFSFTDLDGDGGNSAVIVNGTLAADTDYTGTLKLYNESETPVEDITIEIMDEKDEHQFFFSTDAALTITYNDEDGDGNPVGLSTLVSTGSAGTGTLTITLRHEPAKNAAGVSTGDITNAGGETDIEVDFSVVIQ